MITPIIPVRLGEKVVKEIDFLIKSANFTNRTEVIKEAVRRLTIEERRKIALEILKENYGKGDIKTFDEKNYRAIRNKVAEDYIKKRGIKL